MVKKMKKVKIFGLFTILLFTFSLFSTRTQAATIEGVTFHEAFVPGYELEFEVKICKVTPKEYEGIVKIDLMSGAYPEKGDIITIKFLQDPDDLGLITHDLFSSSEPWAEFYLNDDFLTNDSTLLLFHLQFTVVPITAQLSTGSQNFFDYYYEENKENQFKDETGCWKMINRKAKFIIKEEIVLYGEKREAVWNKDCGVKSKYEFTKTYEQVDETIQAHFIYEVLNEEFKIPFSWSFSVFAFSIVAVIVLIRRRKNQNI